MSNDVKNVLKLSGTPEAKERIFNFIKNGEFLFDFNSIEKMPDSIENTVEGNISDDSYAIYMYEKRHDASKLQELKSFYGYSKISTADFIKLLKKRGASLDIGEKIYFNDIIYGCHTWYDWCKKNWGVKGNAYDTKKMNDTLIFYTPNCGVSVLITKLSVKFPYVTFEYSYSGDCSGYNCAKFSVKNGKLYNIVIPDEGTPEAEELSHEVFSI